MMLRRNRLPIFLLAFTLSGMAVIVSPVVHAATFTVRNDDRPGVQRSNSCCPRRGESRHDDRATAADRVPIRRGYLGLTSPQ